MHLLYLYKCNYTYIYIRIHSTLYFSTKLTDKVVMVTKCLTSLLQMITTNTNFVNFRLF